MRKGQAMIMLLVVTVVLVTMVTAAVAVAFSNAMSTTQTAIGSQALEVAETGAEEGILQLLRNPGLGDPTPYTLNLTIPEGSATVVLTDGANKTVNSTGTVLGYSRQVLVHVHIDNTGKLVIDSWQEQ